ncbi:hypothetical protein Cgig2_005277 [Carnegiea gigantea]|uniref:DUF4283 domain-containing protein n=1 Tax=Carnegiea gigantea TaxID=171969 RepID=A0A9Q1GZR7_9CARY|nr:hypothetical protein Cgig2_005277 [Carnegiea gigantea]
MDLNTEAITSFPIWVRFMDLDIKNWGLASLSKLGGILGIPIKTDKYTMDKTRLNYARLLIDIPIVSLILLMTKIVYGHYEEDCRKKITTRQEWRKVPLQPAQEKETAESSNKTPSQETEVANTAVTQSMDAKGFTPARIDRALVNTLWYDQFDFSQVIYMANSLSNHTALIIDTPSYPKPPSTFQFCDMWIRNSSFLPLETSQLTASSHQGPSQALKLFLRKTKKPLQKLNKSHYADLKTQQSIARVELEKAQLLLQTDPMNSQLLQKEKALKEHYTKLLNSVIDIIRQQCKVEWITYRDECTSHNQQIKQVGMQGFSGKNHREDEDMGHQKHLICRLPKKPLHLLDQDLHIQEAVALKKDNLWVKWVHGRYLKQQEWRAYKAPPDCSWYWKKLVAVKDLFNKGITNSTTWQWQGGQNYTVQKGYQWLLGEMEYRGWSKAIWPRIATPRHSLTT